MQQIPQIALKNGSQSVSPHNAGKRCSERYISDEKVQKGMQLVGLDMEVCVWVMEEGALGDRGCDRRGWMKAEVGEWVELTCSLDAPWPHSVMVTVMD